MINRSLPPIQPAGRGLVSASSRSVRLYRLLGDFSELREVVRSSPETVAAFLQGLFDADGSICRRVLKLSNNNLQILHYAQELLAKLGIETTGPHLDTEKGRNFRDAINSRMYEARKDVYYIRN